MYEGPAVAFIPQGPEGPWSGSDEDSDENAPDEDANPARWYRSVARRPYRYLAYLIQVNAARFLIEDTFVSYEKAHISYIYSSASSSCIFLFVK